MKTTFLHFEISKFITETLSNFGFNRKNGENKGEFQSGVFREKNSRS